MENPFKDDGFGGTVLPDGSFIHASKRIEHGEVVANHRWFLWICTKPASPGKGAKGYVLMDEKGIVYFAGIVQALKSYHDIKGV